MNEPTEDVGELRRRLAQAEADRYTLASEVRTWRMVWENCSEDWRLSWAMAMRLAAVESATDASGALQRAKEVK